MAEHNLVNNNTKDVNCNTPIGNSIESARRVLYDNTQYNVPYNTPAVNQIPISQRLIFSDQPSPQNVNTNSLPLEAVLSDIYTKLNKIDSIPALLGNLEALPSIDRRLGAIENRFSTIETEILQVKHNIKQLENRVSGSEINTTNITQRLNMVERERDQMKFENDELRERFVDVQSRSMRKNLLFGGVEEHESERNDPDNINTEIVLKTFIREKLGIEDEIRFHVVHRLRPRRDRKTRTIVAKFERRKDRDRVLKAAPENSKYSSQESFDQIEGELLSFKTESTVTALIGDFNARPSTLTDYVVPDNKVMIFLNIDEINDVHNYLYEFQKLQEKNIPVERSSEDRGRCNNYGYKMLNFCKNNSIFIANGRICDDAGIGKVTCSEISIVDYLIVSPELFPFITEFQVVDFDPLISDVHCRLHAKFSTLATNDLQNNNPEEGASKLVRWISDKKNQFVDKVENSLLLLDVDELTNRIDEFDVNSISFQTDLDTFVEALNKFT
ncbi:unnamed protein product [Mytilus coruscus]|uniref:Endonuclease/exonuclease/phosphatase domain-containing protein n=1 Tax=Mytilus coruscus TaxID=42192 RepID=A0A6J8E9Y9_MYTCO|nr:unnamed protein product [Mytilus coruscus]